MQRYLRTIAIIAILVILTGCGTAAAPPIPAPTDITTSSKMLVIGLISSTPVKLLKRAQPLADYLATRLTKFGIGAGEVQIVPDPPTLARRMKAGEVDLFFDSPYPAMIVGDQANAQPILRRWKDGIAEYHAVIFTRADSGLHSLTDLNGHMIGLEEQYSTSGYLLPLASLVNAKLKLTKKPELTATVARDEVGYVFTTKSGGDASNTLEWVLNKKVVAGAADQLFFSKIPEATRAKLAVLAETENVARQVVVARPDMDPAMLQTIKSLLMDMDKSPEGRTVLETFQQTTKFDALPAEDLARIQALYKLAQ
jgi:phosphonate transport system substrate-binding protein